jgi:hypothetical protein
MRSQELPRGIEAISRRRFAASAVTAAAASLIPAAAIGEVKRVSASETDLGMRPEGLSVADWDEVHTKYSNILRVYGERFSPEDKRRLVRVLTTNQHMLASIRSFEVQNGDPSACTLRV